jgi:protein-L-isoaspartate(D-aspartate) O-methyltransferase
MDRIELAFQQVNRVEFLPENVHRRAHYDQALPIGYGQTNSQPSTVEAMLRWLDPQAGETILDVGSGSGWTTALLAVLVEPGGSVDAVEIIPELVEFGQQNCQRLDIDNVAFFEAGNAIGLPEHAPYDRILISASTTEFPESLVEQVRTGGKIVIPVRSDVLEITKTSNTTFNSITHPGYIFVPLV